MEASGKIYKIHDVQQISEKFKKQEFVLEMSNNPAYVEKVLFTCLRDNTDKLNDLEVGDEVTVTFNLKGKEWTSPSGEVRFFNTLDAWKIEKKGKEDNQAQSNDDSVSTRVSPDEDSDELPF